MAAFGGYDCAGVELWGLSIGRGRGGGFRRPGGPLQRPLWTVAHDEWATDERLYLSDQSKARSERPAGWEWLQALRNGGGGSCLFSGTGVESDQSTPDTDRV